LAAAVAACLTAQDISATIGGTVLDPSGAGVANAKVTITNTDRNQVVREVTTGTAGTYSVPLLPVGNYSVKVEANGFKTETQTGVVLNAGDNLKINITLQIGVVTETVEVKAAAVNVELGTAAVSNTIEGTQIRELALVTRNYEQLVGLMPGVTANSTDELYIGNSSPAGTAATLPFSVNGNRNSANNWTVDGADNVDRGSNLTLMTFPSVDSIAEFKVERSLYTADTGRAGGAQINVVTKSGTSQFHGSLYEFVRNDAFAANNWINNAEKILVNGSVKPTPLRWNDFGGTIGGPVPIGQKDSYKTFFFFSEEARRIITYTNFNPTLPTQAMLQGTFPVPVCTVYTTSCTQTASQIAPSSINPIAAEYIKDIFSKIPLPATNSITATSSEFFPERNIYNSRQEIARIDHTFTDKFSIWGKFENDSIPTTEPGGLFTGAQIPNLATTNTNSPGRAYVVHAIYNFRPNLLNDVSFNFNQSAIHSTPAGLAAKVNSPDINPPEPYTNTQGVVPTVTFTSGSSIIGYGPYNEYNKNYNFYDSLTWIRGRHTMKFGISVNRYNKTENAASDQGTFAFTSTGNPGASSASFAQAFANFLLGNVASFTQPSADITPNLWAWQDEAWVQDDFKVTPRLTFSAGVRWSYFGQPTDAHGELSSFDPQRYNPLLAPKIDPTTGNIIAGSTTLPYTNGIIIGGENSPWGTKVAQDKYENFAPRVGLAWDPFGDGKTSLRAGYGVYYDSGLFGTYEQSIFQNPPFVSSATLSNAPFNNIAAGTPPGTVSTVYARATQLPNRIPNVQQWSADVQRQLPKDVLLDVGYSGSKGTHLIGIIDLDQAPPGLALANGLHSGTGTIFTSADDPRINAVRPYLGYNAINAIEPWFNSNYNALLVSLRKRFGTAGLIGFAYTYSKNLTDNASDRSNAPESSYNFHEGEYGPATLDRQQVANLNYVYTIPIFKNSHGPAAYALKGWELTGVLSMFTGSPFTVTTSSVDPAGLGLLGNSASSSRPDMTCDPNANAPHQAPGFTGVGLPTWFNTACFEPTPQGQIRPGNAGRGVVRGPGFGNLDFALMKNFDFKERLHLQLRGEAVNATNHPNPNGFFSTNITSSSFGEINTYRAPRRIQIALKLTF
jgi:hypothetical protein